MSRLFLKHLYLAPLLAVKQSPRCRFPTRGLSTSANTFSGIVPKAAENNKDFSNAEAEKLWNARFEYLKDRISRLEDRADKEHDRHITFATDMFSLEITLRREIRDMASDLRATMVKRK